MKRQARQKRLYFCRTLTDCLNFQKNQLLAIAIGLYTLVAISLSKV